MRSCAPFPIGKGIMGPRSKRDFLAFESYFVSWGSFLTKDLKYPTPSIFVLTSLGSSKICLFWLLTSIMSPGRRVEKEEINEIFLSAHFKRPRMLSVLSFPNSRRASGSIFVSIHGPTAKESSKAVLHTWLLSERAIESKMQVIPKICFSTSEMGQFLVGVDIIIPIPGLTSIPRLQSGMLKTSSGPIAQVAGFK